MATLAANKKRDFEIADDRLFNDIPIIADDTVFEGAAVGENVSTGQGRPLVAGDTFMGFAIAKCDNEGGAAAAKNIRLQRRGSLRLPIGGLTDADYGATVYASDDDTFTLTMGGNTAIGKIARVVDATDAIVRFEAADVQSL